MPVPLPANYADPSQVVFQLQRSPRTMANAGFVRTLKLSIFGLNVILTTVGALTTSVALYLLFCLHALGLSGGDDPAAILVSSAVTLLVLALAAGFLLLAAGALGCWAVAQDSRPLLVGHAAALAALLMLQVGVVCALAWLERAAPQRAESAALEMIRRRGTAGHADRGAPWAVLHAVQRHLRCCGVLHYGDYVAVNASIPVSCCLDELAAANSPSQCRFAEGSAEDLRSHPLLHQRGCGALVRRRLRAGATFAFVIIGLLLAAEMVCFTFASYVATTLRSGSSVHSLRPAGSAGYE